jgi:hypothetical protein
LNYSRFSPTKTLAITIMGDERGPATRLPVSDAVTPVLREKTGVTAVVTAGPAEAGAEAEALQGMIAGNNLPEILTGAGLPADNAALAALTSAGAAWDFSDVPTLHRLFPNFTRRIEQWGDLTTWLANEQTPAGTHIRITQDIAPQSLRKLSLAFKGSTYARRTINDADGVGLPAVLFLRDDVLKKIFPRARSQKEQEQFFQKTFSYDTPVGPSDPYKDIPLSGLDDLHSYLVKAKEIIDAEGLKDASGQAAMIPGQLNESNGSATAALAGGMTMYGFWWSAAPFHNADKVSYPFSGPWMKDVLAWWNRCYNEGLLDPGLFSRQDDIIMDEMTRGRFAVMPGRGATAAGARKYARDHATGYGWRQVPAWWPVSMKNAQSDASNRWVSYTSPSGGSIVTKTVKEKDLAQVCNWLDYHASEEFDILKSWGPSAFTTGTDVERRFRAAYRGLESFQAYGISGAKDGYSFGILANSPVSIDPAAWNWEVQIGSLTRYPLAPMYVYPRVQKPGMDFDAEMLDAWSAYWHERQVNFFPQVGWADTGFASLPDWNTTHAPAAAATILGSAADFEANYAAYQQLFTDDGYDTGMQAYQERWKTLYSTYMKRYWKP